MNENDWLKELEEIGIPTTEEDLKKYFETIAKKYNIDVLNHSEFSPFWRLMQAIGIEPTKLLVNHLATKVMPSLYLATASGEELDMFSWSRQIQRFKEKKASGLLTFMRLPGTTGSVKIPAGTVIRTVAINDTIYRFFTQYDAEIATDKNGIKILATAENPGIAYNLGADYLCIIEGDLTGVSVTNATGWLTSQGLDKESDNSLRIRTQNAFSAVASWHVDAKYRAMISSQLEISSELIFFIKNPRGPGSADAWILFDTSARSEELLSTINKFINIDGNHGHGDDLVCKQIPAKPINLIVNYWGTSNATDVENFIRCAFRDNVDYDRYVTKTQAYSVFSFSKLDQELHNFFTGLERINFNLQDITTGLEVARLATIKVERKDG